MAGRSPASSGKTGAGRRRSQSIAQRRQVAALAGGPNDVIRSAKKQLVRLEQNSAAQNPQGDLFDKKPEMPEPEEHPVLKSLRELQPDELSPKEALERIYQLKKLV